VRKIYKEVNYAAVYGAGVATLARSAGVSQSEAKEILEAYWKRNWSVRAIPRDVKTKRTTDGSMWLFNPVSKFWYSLRAEKDIFSTLNQGTGVYCFDRWIGYVRMKRPQLTGQFHDEIILTVKIGHRKECTNLLKWAIGKVNKELKLNRSLDVDVQFGKDYSLIH
jgi:DNA polymerase I-like protein with 3'-5' exonuclease and polymerase domains